MPPKDQPEPAQPKRTSTLGGAPVAGSVIGVSGPAAARSPIFTAGPAGLVAGAVSMALGGHVSASSPRDNQTAQLARQRRELAATSEQEVAEPIATYAAEGFNGHSQQGRRRADCAPGRRTESGR
jgi:VIT1/CCC1 family predicted Fe2+/Mn2+ transporter